MTSEQLANIKANEENTYTTEIDHFGHRKVYGNKKVLKGSQVYPIGFTNRIAGLFHEYDADEAVDRKAWYDQSDSDSDYSDIPEDAWGDAQLQPFEHACQHIWREHGKGYWPC